MMRLVPFERLSFVDFKTPIIFRFRQEIAILWAVKLNYNKINKFRPNTPHDKLRFCIKNAKIKKLRTYVSQKIVSEETYVFVNAKFSLYLEILNLSLLECFFRKSFSDDFLKNKCSKTHLPVELGSQNFYQMKTSILRELLSNFIKIVRLERHL